MSNVQISKEYLKELQYMHRLVASLHEAWLGDPYGEPDEKLIYLRLKRLMDWIGQPEEEVSARYETEGEL
jgi:hypothetical protein